MRMRGRVYFLIMFYYTICVRLRQAIPPAHSMPQHGIKLYRTIMIFRETLAPSAFTLTK